MGVLRVGTVGMSAMACLGLGLVAPAHAATPRVAGAAKVRAAAEVPDPWVEKGGHSVSFAGGKGSVVEAVSGDVLQVRLKNVAQGVLINPTGGVKNLDRAGIAGAFGDLNGRVKGVIVGKTTGGKPVEVPVVFTSGVSGGETLTLSARPVGGQVPDELAEVFPAVHPVDAQTVGSKMRFVGVHATDGGAQTWRLSAATRSGALKANGADGYTVRLPKAPKRGVGVQMGHEAAGLSWSFVDKHWSNVADRGVPARVVVQGIGKRSITRTVVLDAAGIKDGKTLRFSGEALSSLSGKAKKALRTMRGAAVTLVSSNSGLDKSFVVITGDSISSGESGRYIADYEAASDFQGLLPQSAKRMCEVVDLACTGAKDIEEDVAGAGMQLKGGEYEEKPSLAYEKGTQGPGECHRSYSAPGTWLARYYSTQQGKKVESINIACSGATTEAMTKPFNGQRPQADVLKEISNAVHVPFVTNTMGANDIGFSAIAIGCYMKVAEPFLEAPEDGETSDLMSKLGSIIDAPWNPWFGVQKVKGQDKFEYKNPYCHNDPQIGGAAEKAIKKLPGLYEKAMNEVLDAAPHAKVIAANYPNLIPHNSQSNFPKAQALAEDGPVHFFSETGIWTDEIPESPNFDAWTFQQLKANQSQWVAYWTKLLTQAIMSENLQYQLVSTMNLLLESDMNWAAWEMIPALDDAVYETAKDLGGRVIPVDLRQVLNGREYTNPYKGAAGVDDPHDLIAANWTNLGNQAHMGTTWPGNKYVPVGNPPDKLRATFVTAPLAGLPMTVPVLCPPNLKLNGKQLPAGTCIGSMNEPLHPNWRGQAAQGQCYVAIVTGAAGEGNACVRSVGNNEWVVPDKGMIQVSWNNSVNGTDKLCVTKSPRTDYDWKKAVPDKPYENCGSSMVADPTWDAERWAKVAEYGNYK